MSRLEGIEILRVRMRLAEPWVTTMGVVDWRQVVLVRAVIDGADGWGECVAQPEPTYSSEYETGAWDVLTAHLAPRLLAAGSVTGAAVAGALGAVKGHQMAKAALEAAVLDAELRLAGIPLVDRLRAVSDRPGPRRSAVAVGVSIGATSDIAALVEEVGKRVDEGYSRVKIKIAPGWDTRPVAALRRAFGSGLSLQVDANGSYAPLGVERAAHALRLLGDEGVVLIEQPLADDDLVGHARLGALLTTPICLDETIVSDATAAAALALGACRIINVKPGRVGGLHEAVRIHDRCARAGIAAWCGGMLETGIGRASGLALATLRNFSLPADLSAADRYWVSDIVDPPAVLDPGGVIAVPAGPGSGVSVSIPPGAVTASAWMPAGG